MRSTSRKKFKSNIRKKLAGVEVSFAELVEGAGGITGLNGHCQSKRVGAWPSTSQPIDYIGSVISSSTTGSLDISSIGLSTGDTLIVCCCLDNTTSAYSLSGATTLVNNEWSGGMQIAVFSLTISGTAPSTISLGAVTNSIIAAGFSNVGSVGVSTAATTSSNVDTITPNSVTFSNGGVAVIFAAQDDTVTATATAPTGYTIAQQGGIAYSTLRSTGALMYKTDVPVGTESPSAVTWSETDTLAAYTIKLEQN